MSNNLGKALARLFDWVKPDLDAPVAGTVADARSLLARRGISELLNLRDTDTVRNLIYTDDGAEVGACFALGIGPLLAAGSDAEGPLEALVNACPPDTVLQWGVASTPQVQNFVNTWTSARLEKCSNPLLRQIALRRRDFLLATAIGPSALPKQRLHPRSILNYLCVRIPYKGDKADQHSMDRFVQSVLDVRSSMVGTLSSLKMDAVELTAEHLEFLLFELLNPHMAPEDRLRARMPGVALNKNIMDRETRAFVTEDGYIGFHGGEGPAEIVVAPITVDAYPEEHHLFTMSKLLGAPEAWDSRITVPFWMYTNVHVMDPDKGVDAVTAKQGLLTRQTMSESQWYRSMMGHLFKQKANVDQFLGLMRKGHNPVRAYTGIHLYCSPEDVKQTVDYVRGVWRDAGFRASPEKYIGLPAFIAGLPFQYSPAADPPNSGMQRAVLMHSLNAATLSLVQGDWQGTGPMNGGPLMMSRRGQLASFDLLKTSTNYNFVIVASSGSGKSFLANEIVCDFLSKGGIARLIDVGGSYQRFCELMGGANLIFEPDRPQSLNPFWGVEDQKDLNELMPLFRTLLRQMAYPLQPEEDTPAWEYQALETAVQEAWLRYRGQLELRHVYEWLRESADSRAVDLAFQLQTYAVGRLQAWFNGPREVRFDNQFVVIELEHLKQDVELQSVVLSLVMYLVTKEMYLAPRSVPKLLAVDEAWDLLGGMKTGKFIETAFRRIRKYNGTAGVITQSFEDFEKSAAAKATIENASWQFILNQRPESLQFAADNKRIVGGDWMLQMLRSVKSGPGFSEVFVRAEHGSGVYRFVTDRHTYYTFSTTAKDIVLLEKYQDEGMSLEDAIDRAAREDYERTWGADVTEALLGAPSWRARP